jgi:hypothetical protein
MSAPADWPRSIHPAVRGNSWNTLQDLLADAYRPIKPDERVMALLVVVRDGEGRSALIVRGQDGTRRIDGDEDLSERSGSA